MRSKMQKFLTILKLEFDDIEADLNMLLELYKKSEACKEITEYVYLGNSGLARAELGAMRLFSRLLDTVSLEEFDDINEIESHILDLIDKEMTAKEYPRALYSVIERKVVKVKNYLEAG